MMKWKYKVTQHSDLSRCNEMKPDVEYARSVFFRLIGIRLDKLESCATFIIN